MRYVRSPSRDAPSRQESRELPPDAPPRDGQHASTPSRQNSGRRGSPRPRHGSVAVEPEVREAFDVLKRATPGGERIGVDDLGELIYLVLRQSYSSERRAAMLRVVDPVHALEDLDVAQCQFVVNKIRLSSRAQHLEAESTRRFKRTSRAEAESEECCTCNLDSASASSLCTGL